MTKKLMMASIEVLIEIEDDGQDGGRSADLLAESLRPLLRAYADGPSDIIDWRYALDDEGRFSQAIDHNGDGFELSA